MFFLSSVSLFIFYQNDFQTYVSDRSQCFKSHGMFDFAYKLQLHYNIYRLVFTIWMVKIIKMKIPLEICHENQQNEIFKIKDVQNIL